MEFNTQPFKIYNIHHPVKKKSLEIQRPKNGIHNQEKNQSIETNLEMTEMTELTDKNFERADRNMLKRAPSWFSQ